jgi:hypothetical protein
VNTRKGKCYHRGPVERKTKFETEKYWKSRKNRALQQQSRRENEVDHEDFLLPDPKLSKWDIARRNAVDNLSVDEFIKSWEAGALDKTFAKLDEFYKSWDAGGLYWASVQRDPSRPANDLDPDSMNLTEDEQLDFMNKVGHDDYEDEQGHKKYVASFQEKFAVTYTVDGKDASEEEKKEIQDALVLRLWHSGVGWCWIADDGSAPPSPHYSDSFNMSEGEEAALLRAVNGEEGDVRSEEYSDLITGLVENEVNINDPHRLMAFFGVEDSR